MATEKRLIFLDEAIARIKDDGILGSGYSDDERMDDVIDMLESCHVVDAVEVVHGNWVYYSTSMQECSNCKRHTARHKFKYCPYCGAVMGDKLHYAID